MHQLFMQTYNTTAHQGLLKDQLVPPIPLQVLGAAKGRFYTLTNWRGSFPGPLPTDDEQVWLCHA